MTIVKSGFVYIVSNKPNGVLYTGVTSDLIQRVYQHKTHMMPGFSDTYNTNLLVWYEFHDGIELAIQREKQIKLWKRSWKIEMIEAKNPMWSDLYPALLS